MTMVMSEKTIKASEFKAKCLALMDDVSRTGRPLSITKRGRVVARLIPSGPVRKRSLKGSIVAQSDLTTPIDAPWDAAK